MEYHNKTSFLTQLFRTLNTYIFLLKQFYNFLHIQSVIDFYANKIDSYRPTIFSLLFITNCNENYMENAHFNILLLHFHTYIFMLDVFVRLVIQIPKCFFFLFQKPAAYIIHHSNTMYALRTRAMV